MAERVSGEDFKAQNDFSFHGYRRSGTGIDVRSSFVRREIR